MRKWRALTDGIEPSTSAAPTVVDALLDDLNTAGAIAALHELARKGDVSGLKASAGLLGLLGDNLGGWDAAVETSGDVTSLIESLLEARKQARADKNFARADVLRDGFAAAGVLVKDTADGAVWELAADFDASKLEALK